MSAQASANMARRSTRFCQFGVLLFLCLRFGGSPAADLRVLSQDEALCLLFGNQFAELDSRYGAIQSAYKAGNISDEDLRAAGVRGRRSNLGQWRGAIRVDLRRHNAEVVAVMSMPRRQDRYVKPNVEHVKPNVEL
jgi:hypothetical protein